MQKIFVVGSGGHAHSILAVIERQQKFMPIGFIDSYKAIGDSIHGFPVLGGLDDVAELCESQCVTRFVIAVGDNYSRSSLTKQIKKIVPVSDFPPLVDPTAVIASSATIDSGVVVMAQAHIGPGCILEEGVLINTKASLDHDSTVDSFASLAPGVVTGGGVRIGECSAICIGSKLLHRVSIGPHTVVGAGSLVLADLPARVVAYGSPASIVRTRMPDSSYL